MAYTKAPNISTYKTVEFPIVRQINKRSLDGSDYDKDETYHNVTIDTLANKITGQLETVIQKRCGQKTFNTTALSAGQVVTAIKGWTISNGTGYLLVGINDGTVKVYSLNGGSFGDLVTTLATASTGFSSSPLYFEEFLYDNGTTKMCISDGLVICTVDSSWTVVKVTDADTPTPVNGLVFLDGYLFTAKGNTGDIYNSNLNDPTSWTAGDFISAEAFGDKIQWLGRLKNYIVAIGWDSTEFFYNNANPTASPLQRNAALMQKIGLPSSIVSPVYHEDALFLVGRAGGSAGFQGVGLYRMTIDSLERIRIPLIEQRLNEYSTTNGAYFDFINLDVFTFPHNGVTVLSIGNLVSGTNLLMNLENRTLSTMTVSDATPFKSTNVSAQFYGNITIGRRTATGGGKDNLFYYDANLNQDENAGTTASFTFTIITGLEDFDTINRKTMNRLVLIGEKPSSTASVDVSWTDDDYQNYSTAVSVDMFQELPSITRLGNFRRRALKITGTHAQPFSLYKVECDLNMGQS